MTNNEAAKWIQLYIDLAKIDPSTGEEAYLNEDDRKTLEAMEMAIDALTCNQLATDCISRQPEERTEERTEMHACDCISRQAVTDTVRKIILGFFSEDGAMNDTEKTLLSVSKAVCNGVRELPSAQPTLYGYNIGHLDLIARILQKEDLPPDRIVDALTDIGRIVEIVKDEYEEALRKAVEQCTI